MLFSPPPETLAYWKQRPATPATAADIAMLEARLGLKAPPSYVEFMTTYGNVEFDDEINSRFEYVYESGGQLERRSQLIAFIKSPQKAIRYWEGLQSDQRVSIPAHLLPFGMDYGQGELLIEFGQPTGRVYYWDFDTQNWDSGTTRIAFVANDLVEFIDTLKPYEE